MADISSYIAGPLHIVPEVISDGLGAALSSALIASTKRKKAAASVHSLIKWK